MIQPLKNGTPSLNNGHFTANVCCGTFSHCCKTFPVCCEFFQLATKLKSAILESMDSKASKISMVLVRVAHGPVWSLDFTNSCPGLKADFSDASEPESFVRSPR